MDLTLNFNAWTKRWWPDNDVRVRPNRQWSVFRIKSYICIDIVFGRDLFQRQVELTVPVSFKRNYFGKSPWPYYNYRDIYMFRNALFRSQKMLCNRLVFEPWPGQTLFKRSCDSISDAGEHFRPSSLFFSSVLCCFLNHIGIFVYAPILDYLLVTSLKIINTWKYR